VLVIAVTVAFLVGTTLFVVAAGSQTAEIAGDLGSPGSATYYGSHDAAAAAAGPDDLVLTVAAVTGPDGDSTYAVGVPSGTDREFGDRQLVGDGATLGGLDAPATHRLAGERSVTVSVSPRSNSILAPSWYAVSPTTVQDLGPTGALVVEDEGSVGEAALRGVLGFFTSGTEQLLGVVSLIAVAGGLLVGITAYSTTRMTVADRRDALRVIRATGGTPRSVLALFGLRAALIGGVGVALGYAIGVITANGAVSLAVAVGLPTSLTVAMTPSVAAFLAVVLAVMVVVSAFGGLLAARRIATVPPASIDDPDADRVPPRIVGRRRRRRRRARARHRERAGDHRRTGRQPSRRQPGTGGLRRRARSPGDRRERRNPPVRRSQWDAAPDARRRLRGLRGRDRRPHRRRPAATRP